MFFGDEEWRSYIFVVTKFINPFKFVIGDESVFQGMLNFIGLGGGTHSVMINLESLLYIIKSRKLR